MQAHRIVVVGNGMVGQRFLEALAGGELAPGAASAARALEVTVIAAEPRPAYDRVHLSSLFSGRTPGDLARVFSPWGSMIGRVRTSGAIARGQLFAPIHWSAVHASDARVGALASPAVDPLSGQPEFKFTPARVEPFLVDWFGVLVVRRPIDAPDVAWWTLVRGEDCVRYELGGRGRPADWEAWTRRLLGLQQTGSDETADDFVDYRDEACGVYRAARFADERLDACLYVAPRPRLPDRAWLMSLFRAPVADRDRIGLLAGRPLVAGVDAGPLVCSCFGVGRDALAGAIRAHGLRDEREVGARLRAGTNCGSCLPEIRALLRESAA